MYNIVNDEDDTIKMIRLKTMDFMVTPLNPDDFKLVVSTNKLQSEHTQIINNNQHPSDAAPPIKRIIKFGLIAAVSVFLVLSFTILIVT